MINTSANIGNMQNIQHNQRLEDAPKSKNNLQEGIGDIIDSSVYGDKVEIALTDPSYQNISLEDAAKTMGYFTQKMENEGFPWELYKPAGKNLKHKEAISEMEALNRLKRGEEVIFQPMRVLNLSLDSTNLTAISSIGGENMQPIGEVATKAKDANVSSEMGIDVKNGAPITIKSFGEMKLLNEIFNPDAKVEDGNEVGKAAKSLSFFAKTSQTTKRPWRFVSTEKAGRVSRTFKEVIKRGLPGLLAGAAVGLMIGGPIGLVTGSLGVITTAGIYGAAAGGTLMTASAIKKSAKGQEMSAYKALEHVLNDKPVVMQEQKARSVSLPIVGSLTWYTDQGKGSVVTGQDELSLYTSMQDQK